MNVSLGLVIISLAASSIGSAAVIFERLLPVSNVNVTTPNGTNGDRSNAAPLQGSFGTTPYILGDDFTLSSNSVVTSISVFEVGNAQVASATDTTPTATPQQEFSAINLYVGPDGTPLPLVSSSYTATRVFYSGGLNFKSMNNNNYFPVYELTYNVNLNIPGGVLYDFAVGATPIGSNTFALAGANFARSGLTASTFQGSDDMFIFYEGNPPVATFNGGAGDIINYPNGIDMNVIINGSAVPEPTTLGFLSLGLGMLAIRRRK